MAPDPWLDYSGPLCDEPSERRGWDPGPVESVYDDVSWEDLSREERAVQTRLAGGDR